MSNGIDFAARFSNRAALASKASANTEDRPKSQLWLNIGYETGDKDYPFVSLPVGIPLDGMEPKKAKGSNQDYLQFVAAQNALLKQIMEGAEQLKPGEDAIIGIEGSPLQIQIRRVKDEPEEVAADENNRFARPMLLSMKSED